jgi:hypothetical protein
MSYPTLKQVSELLNSTVREIELSAGRAQAAVAREAHVFGAKQGGDADRAETEDQAATAPPHGLVVAH